MPKEMAKEVSKEMTKEMNKKVDEEFPIKRFPPVSQGGPGRNRKPPFGALVTLIINTIVLSIVIIMSTVVVLCIVPRLIPCCSDYYRDSLSVAGVPPDYRDVRGPGDGAGQLVVLLPHPIINNATPCLSSVVSANLETGDYRRGRRIIIEVGNDGRWPV